MRRAQSGAIKKLSVDTKRASPELGSISYYLRPPASTRPSPVDIVDSRAIFCRVNVALRMSLFLTLASCANPSAVTEVLPAAAGPCPDNQIAHVGSTECRAVGATVIPVGFVAASWGFTATLPSTPCEGVTRAALGSDKCVPLDDCDAPFPPPGTDVVVSQRGGTYGGLNVVKTIDDATLAVKTGGTIAIDEGNYSHFVVTRNANLIGRCASKVKVVEPSSQGLIAAIISATANFSHMSFEGGQVLALTEGPVGSVATFDAVRISSPHTSISGRDDSKIVIRSSVIEGTKGPQSGTIGTVDGAQMEIVDSQIRHTDGIGGAFNRGTLTFTRVVVTEPLSTDTYTSLVTSGGAKFSAVESVIHTAEEFADLGTKGPDTKLVIARDEVSSVEIDRTEIVQEGREALTMFVADEGCYVRVRGSALYHRGSFTFHVHGGTQLSVSDTTIEGSTDRVRTRGVALLDRSSGVFDRVAMRGTQHVGFLAMGAGASLAMKESLLDGVAYRPEHVFYKDVKMISAGIVIGEGEPNLAVEGSTIRNVEGVGITIDSGTRARISGSIIENTSSLPEPVNIDTGPFMEPWASTYGEAIRFMHGALDLSESTIRNNEARGVGIYGGTALITDAKFLGNGVGLATLIPVRDVTERPMRAEADTVLLFNATFRGNKTDRAEILF